MRKESDKQFNRVMDANFNRAKEGLRVCEDICRFVLDAKRPTREFKRARHQLTEAMSGMKMRRVVSARNIERDVGRGSTRIEFRRRNTADIFYANSQRVKESIRVLEEFAKLRSRKSASGLKKLRYKVYALEKNVIERY